MRQTTTDSAKQQVSNSSGCYVVKLQLLTVNVTNPAACAVATTTFSFGLTSLVNQSRLGSITKALSNKNPWEIGGVRRFMSPNQQCQSPEGKTQET